jgi:hypothetical protein
MHWNKTVKRASLVGFAAAALLIAVGVSSASAYTYHQFKECPLENSKVNRCLYSKTFGGEVAIGHPFLGEQTKVKIVNPIVLQGGYYETNTKTHEEAFVGARSGPTLEPVGQPVPGGLAGLINCPELEEPYKEACEFVFENEWTGVNAIAELAKPASDIGINTDNLINGTGVALSLPIKIRLENPFLGSSCYVGSESKPITWNLTTGATEPKGPGPNKSINGVTGTVKLPASEIVEILGSELVDNTFPVKPGASGCGGWPLEYLLDPIIEAKLGVPDGAAYNTVKLKNNNELISRETAQEAEEAGEEKL